MSNWLRLKVPPRRTDRGPTACVFPSSGVLSLADIITGSCHTASGHPPETCFCHFANLLACRRAIWTLVRKVVGFVFGVKKKKREKQTACLSEWTLLRNFGSQHLFSLSNGKACLQKQRRPRSDPMCSVRRSSHTAEEWKLEQLQMFLIKNRSINHTADWTSQEDKDPLLCCTVNISHSCKHTLVA